MGFYWTRVIVQPHINGAGKDTHTLKLALKLVINSSLLIPSLASAATLGVRNAILPTGGASFATLDGSQWVKWIVDW